ncbi:MAG: FAD-dependent oxidoreductase [Candidatus Omnitrophica bacterium]|nr:FAD-dependent oxidoreductase [Candidatus Omnitrophota bacterium]
MNMYDLIIIGAGPAGITASVYAARKKMNFLLITKDIGGQAAWSGDVENYTGYQFISGADLTAKFEEHMKAYDIKLNDNEEVTDIKKESGIIRVKTKKGVYDAKALIIASGKKSRELGIPGEKEFKNKGITYCATCDGPLFSGRDVAVIGGGNAGLDAVMQLIKIARLVYLIEVAPYLSGDDILQTRMKESEKVTVLTDARVTAVLGDNFVTGIKIKVKNEERILHVEGVFVEIGLIPNSEFARGIEKRESGEIKVNSYNETSVPGIFAAGDVTDVPEKQIIIASGEGAKATLSAFRYLTRQK